MSYTEERVLEMTDREIEKLVAITANIRIAKENCYGIVIHQTQYSGTIKRYYEPCNNANDYMDLAKANEVSIEYKDNMVSATCAVRHFENYKPLSYISSKTLPKEETGRAVCEAYLLKMLLNTKINQPNQ